MVKTIPIARREGPINPLANDTKSIVPPTPAPVKLQKQVKVQPEKAIEIPDQVTKKRKASPQLQVKDLYHAPEPYKKNQAPSNIPQAANTPMYGIQGAGGIDVGTASVLGNQFGAYADLIRDRISQHWNRASVNALPSQKCQVSFTIARNGTITSVNVTQPSGNYLLDTSAKRAVLDASPLPPLPAQFERNEATVDLYFQLEK
jgi:protein TonB